MNKLNGLTLPQCIILIDGLFRLENYEGIGEYDRDDYNYLLLQLKNIRKNLEDRELKNEKKT